MTDAFTEEIKQEQPPHPKRRKRENLWDIDEDGNRQSTPSSNLNPQVEQHLARLGQQQTLQATMQMPGGPGSQPSDRRIYVGSLSYDQVEEHIRIPFSNFGTILKIDMPRDSQTHLSKGFCFVEYATPESATAALNSMNGFLLAGRPIKVNRPSASGSGGGGGGGSTAVTNPMPIANVNMPAVSMPRSNRIFVGSIVYDLCEDNIKEVFEPFGRVLKVSLTQDPLHPGKHKGYGFIDFEDEKSAEDAIREMNGFDLIGRPLVVGRANAKGQTSSQQPVSVSAPPPPPPMTYAPQILTAAAAASSLVASIAATGTGAPAGVVLPGPPLPVISSASQRVDMMNRLAAARAPTAQVTNILCLKNMVTIEEIDENLEEETKEECENFGPVESIVIRKRGPPMFNVEIFVVFKGTDGATKARASLDKRFFAGRQVSAEFATNTN